MKSNIFSFTTSVFTVLLISSHFDLSTSTKLELPLKVTDKQASCTSAEGCSDGFVCVNVGALACSSSDSFCVCLQSDLGCTPRSSCLSGFTCVHSDGTSCTDSSEIYVCVPTSPVDPPTNNPPTSSTDDSEFCVDATLLSHLPSHQLVYKSHRRASVLCDKSASCATPGHIVVFERKAMMMSSYCNLVGNCHKRVMNVNSPTMSRKLRVSTKTDNLQFTALASRYQTVVEERFLSALVHMSM